MHLVSGRNYPGSYKDISGIAMKTRHSKVTSERVSDIFGYSLETAKKTTNVTTQHGVRSAVHPL
eukprot:11291821-Ditylum_brightwellii.AAC.1